MKIKNLRHHINFICRIFKKEKFPLSYNKINFKFDTVVHFLTWRCNSRCITCNLWKTPFSEREKEIWNLENIRKLYSTLNTNSVYLTGGEPIIVPDFENIVECIYQTSGAMIDFTTNGILLQRTKQILFQLKKKKIPFSVSFSCNGFEKTHDFSRGINGNYNRILELIEFCKQNHIQFGLNYTVFPFNIDETLEFIKYWRDNNVYVALGIGRNDKRYGIEKNYLKFVTFKEEDYAKLEQVLFQLSKIYPDYLPHYYLVKKMNRGEKFFPCFGLVKRIEIGPYGEVYPCDGMRDELCLGNLKESDFDFNLFIQKNQSRIKEIFEIIKNKKCQPCEYICDLLYGEFLTLSRRDLIKILNSRISQKIRRFQKI